MAFYKVVMNGQMLGQDVRNILYYRTGVGIDVGGLGFGGAEELAEGVRDEVWLDGWTQAVSTAYTLSSIDVYPMNELFQFMYTLPYTLPVNNTGADQSQPLSPAAYIQIKFGFDAAVLGQAQVAPRKGYVAIAGLTEDMQSGGRLVGSVFDDTVVGSVRNRFKSLAAKLASNIESITPPVIFFPIRMKRILGGLYNGWADIATGVYQDEIKWRRSRMLED